MRNGVRTLYGKSPFTMNLQLTQLVNDLPTQLVVRRGTKKRLDATCFRGKEKALAGNLSLWNDCFELFADPFVVESLVIDASETVRTLYRSASICINYGPSVGWSGTDQIEKYTDDSLECFNLNEKSTGLRVLTGLTEFTAHHTNLVTIVYEVKQEGNVHIIIVHSVYPGEDVGELYGNVSLRESVVFFDLNHPGEK